MDIERKLNHSRKLREEILLAISGTGRKNNRGQYERRLNLQGTIMPELDVPTLVPASVMQEWLKDDPEPIFVIEVIDIPCKANGLIYEEGFFRKFIDFTSTAPIPGSAAGHTIDAMKRPPTDIIMIGGKIEGGKAYFKNYIPPIGESGSNEVLIKQAKSSMLNFSLVAYTRDEIRDGEIYVLEPVGGVRNDLVELGAGAMRQQVFTI